MSLLKENKDEQLFIYFFSYLARDKILQNKLPRIKTNVFSTVYRQIVSI